MLFLKKKEATYTLCINQIKCASLNPKLLRDS